jgi:SanA protein
MRCRFHARKWLAYGVPVMLICLLTALLGSHWLIGRNASPHIYGVHASLPHREVGLVLGCSKQLSDGRLNLFFQYRIERAIQLFREESIDYILVSGDHAGEEYSEPVDMRASLLQAGISSDHIFMDEAGFSTLDSMIRAQKILQGKPFTVISQPFHIERTIYIGRSLGIEVIGAAAKDLHGYHGYKTHLREYLARVKALVDVHFLKYRSTSPEVPVVLPNHLL